MGEGETAVPAFAGRRRKRRRAAAAPATHVACASTGGRILTFEIGELKAMAKGGRGLMLIDLEAKDTLAGAAAYTRSVNIEGIGRGGKEREETLEIRSLNNARGARRARARRPTSASSRPASCGSSNAARGSDGIGSWVSSSPWSAASAVLCWAAGCRAGGGRRKPNRRAPSQKPARAGRCGARASANGDAEGGGTLPA